MLATEASDRSFRIRRFADLLMDQHYVRIRLFERFEPTLRMLAHGAPGK